MEIEKGIGNGTENEGGRLGALPSTTACLISMILISKEIDHNMTPEQDC